MKAVFDTRPGSGYKDDIFLKYHFPNRYLAQAQRSINDWIVYREPRRGGGREGYIAVARVVGIEPDPADPTHSYAFIAAFLPFDDVVPIRREIGFYETMLGKVPNPSRIGAALQGKSIRVISEADFGAIARAGMRQTLDPENAERLELDLQHTLTLTRWPSSARRPRNRSDGLRRCCSTERFGMPHSGALFATLTTIDVL